MPPPHGMQNIQSIPGGTGRIFALSGGVGGGGGGGGVGNTGAAVDRRFRPYPQQNLKCPRCESLNTKFCYYNNYNLSQPRHFCKSCRRYWTKGGVLRNVPVGGGCRKSSKRSTTSSSKSSRSSHKSNSKDHCRVPAVPSLSSSNSSSLTAGTADASATHNPDPRPSFDPSSGVLLETVHQETTAEIFPETDSFTSMMAAAANPGVVGLNFADISQFRLPAQQPQALMPPPPPTCTMVDDEIKMQGITGEGFTDQTHPVDLLLPPLQDRIGTHGGGSTGLDWQGILDRTAGLFDSTVYAFDQGGYWNQNHWGESDPSLHLP